MLLESNSILDKNCLTDEATYHAEYSENLAEALPGQKYSIDEQCVQRIGLGSTYCGGQKYIYDSCDTLRCTDPGAGDECVTTGPASDGTHCGDGKWCVQKVVLYLHPKQRSCLIQADSSFRQIQTRFKSVACLWQGGGVTKSTP